LAVTVGAVVGPRIVKAFDPLVELLQSVGYPLGVLLIMAGTIRIMLGQRKAGLDMIKAVAIGYLGLQFAPTIMMLVADVAKAMRP
jgi:hypothetical protein